MICKNCGTRMTRDTSKVLTSIPAQYEYKCAKCGCMAYGTIEADWDEVNQLPVDHAQDETMQTLEQQVRNVMQKTMDEKLHPLVQQMTKLLCDAFEAGFDTGLSCGKFVNYNKGV